MPIVKYKNNLELVLNCDRQQQTACQHLYSRYPLRLSTPFYLEGAGTKRAYYYLINTSPGLLAGDEIDISLQLKANSNLYFTDQAATKVHQMPQAEAKAVVNYQIKLEANSSLEFIPKPIILYRDAALSQKTVIRADPTANLFLSEIVLPGRLAKQEYYDFKYFANRLEIRDLSDKPLFIDATRLEGQQNQFQNTRLFTALPIMGTAIAMFPSLDIDLLVARLDNLELDRANSLETAITILPHQTGIYFRAMSDKTRAIEQYFRQTLNCIRSLTQQAPLPHIPN